MKASNVLSFIVGALVGAAYVMYQNCKPVPEEGASEGCCSKETPSEEEAPAAEEEE